MQLRYVFSELGQGLRRNLTMHLAVILTLVVSLTLVGVGLMFQQQASKAATHFGDQLQITVYLCRNGDTNPVCPNPVTEAQKAEIAQVVEDNPEVADIPDPVPGTYTVVAENYAGGDDAHDWSGRVTFRNPDPPQYSGIQEAWQLTCTNKRGTIFGSREVVVDRGESVRVGRACRPHKSD